VLKTVIVRKMLHNILHPAIKNVAQPVNGVDLHILILPQTVKLRTVHIVVGIQIILCDTLLIHCLPKAVIFYHCISLLAP
jgi:hypothetical protein